MKSNGKEPVKPDAEKSKLRSQLIGGIIFVLFSVVCFIDPDSKPSPLWAYVIWIIALLLLLSFGIWAITDAILEFRKRRRK
jgi:hypothetical protein